MNECLSVGAGLDVFLGKRQVYAPKVESKKNVIANKSDTRNCAGTSGVYHM